MDGREKCGVFGVYGLENASELTYLGLFSLQHRGQESAGIAVSDGKTVREKKGMGLVSEVFTSRDLKGLPGHIALGHVRYSTTGSSSPRNVQPFIGESRFGHLAVAHNGNLTNALAIWKKLSERGAVFQSSMDTELILHLIAQGSFDSLEDSLKDALWQIQGAFSLGILSSHQLIAVRDPWGFRPLSLGKLGDGYIISSESCAFNVLGAEFMREIEPGEMIIIDEKGLRSFFYAYSPRKAFCIFELIYFARPDSIVFGNQVYQARKNMGKMLAEEEDCSVDMVVPVPDSGTFAALGFSETSGIPLEFAMVRNPYVGRTFIRPEQGARDLAVKIKLDPIKELIRGKKIIVIEDSIVRGSTSRQRIATLKEAGAKEVHMRVSSPPHIFPCHYGIDFPTRRELIASNKSVEEVRKYLGLDSLRYITIEGLKKSVTPSGENYCFACFNGDYPVLPQEIGKLILEERQIINNC
ncbi:MAG: amidophosphoribosyltransferase [Candidatus Atribacteria bacterium]|nr:amidophosphoribosyltransferase [Candidatus Atribacteria bacterium]